MIPFSVIQNHKERKLILVGTIGKDRVSYFSQLIHKKAKKISATSLGEVKKIEALAKQQFSYIKQGVVLLEVKDIFSRVHMKCMTQTFLSSC